MLDFNIFLHFLLFKRLNHRKNYVLFICIACAIQIASAKGETIPTSLEFGGDGFDIPAGEVKNRLGVSAKLRIKGLGLNLGATENVQGSLNYVSYRRLSTLRILLIGNTHIRCRGHGGRVVTLSPPTSAAGVRSPSWP